MNPRIFREYDIRGVVDRDLSPPVVRLIGQAIGTHMGGARRARVALGRDNRLSSPDYYQFLREGLCAAGCDVTGIGMVPTPCLSFATHHLDVQGGVQITGSHNPPEFNGFKITKDKEAIYGQEIQALYHLIRDGKLHKASQPGGFREVDVQPDYVARASRGLTLERPVKVVIDAGNGIAGPLATRTLKAIGAEVTGIFTKPDGTYPNHHPDPTIPENLKSLIAKVKETGAEAGIGFDGDGDRLGVVDSTGRIIWGDELLILYAGPILARRPGEAIVFDVKCSSRLAEAVQKMGGRPVMSATGHSLIRARLVAEKAPLGGELSGHIFFVDGYLGYDDAIYSAARLLHLLGAGKQTLVERMREIPAAIATPEMRVDCTDEEKFAIVEEIKAHFRRKYEVIEVDGARINFSKGWGLVRASNTQPALVLRFEALDEASLQTYQREVFAQLKKFPSVKIPNA